jgi:hypothetical protein
MAQCGLDLKVIELSPAQVLAEQFPNSIKYDIRSNPDGGATCTPVLWWDDASYIAYQCSGMEEPDWHEIYMEDIRKGDLSSLTMLVDPGDFWQIVAGMDPHWLSSWDDRHPNLIEPNDFPF